MKKYLATVKNTGVALLIAFIFLGIAYLFGIDLNAKRYILYSYRNNIWLVFN